MFSRFLLTSLLLLGVVALAQAADWPQFLGPSRNGVVKESPALAEAWPKKGPKLLWQSEEIPNGGKGGFCSPAMANGRVVVFVNWKDKIPFDQRTLSEDGLKKLGWFPEMLPAELTAAMEEARNTEERGKLKGDPLKAWIDAWVKAHLNAEQQKTFGALVSDRLNRGKNAMPFDVFDKLVTIKGKEFPTQAALEAWLTEQGIAPEYFKRITDVIPNGTDVAADVIVCLDAATGETKWKTRMPGRATDWGSSSVPCLVGDRCYVAGDKTAYCLEMATGAILWSTPLSGKEVCSSFLALDDMVIIQAGQLTALDAATGALRWQQPAVGGDKQSPYPWQYEGKTYLLCNTGKEIVCVNPLDGTLRWQAPGGGLSSPVVDGNRLVFIGGNKEVGIRAYDITPDGATERWQVPFADRGVTALIYNGYVYAYGGGGAATYICVNLESGQIAWQEKSGYGELSSMVAADGKLLAVHENGRALMLLKPDPAQYTLLAKASLKIMRCAVPVFADGKVYLRLENGIVCLDLTAEANPVVPMPN